MGKRRAAIIFAAIITFSCVTANAKEYLTKKEALELAFPQVDRIEKEFAILTRTQKQKLKKTLSAKSISGVYRYYVGWEDNKPVGYAVVDKIRGKTDLITFMVVVNPDGAVKMVEILRHVESPGKAVSQKRFLSQFEGKKASDGSSLKSDIRHISGATISCRAITRGVRKVLAHLSVLERFTPTLDADQKGSSTKKNKEEAQQTEEQPSKEKDLRAFTRSQLLMGTTFDVTIYTHDKKNADGASSLVFTEVARIERLISTYREDSEISLLNRSPGKGPVPLSREVVALIARSKKISELTGGAFDITVGPIVALWKEAARRNSIPSEESIQNTRKSVGNHLVMIDMGKQEGQILDPYSRIDLGGIGKGYALDRAAQVLREAGIKSAMLNFGGEILVVGTPPDKKKWTVHIRHPLDPDKTIYTFHIAEGAVSTSSDSERGIEIQGKQYSHIIDPRTCRPVRNDIASVTIVAPTAEEADALSTALFVMGRESGMKIANSRPHIKTVFWTYGDGIQGKKGSGL